MSRTGRLAAFAVPAVLCALWTLAAGKDVSWDLLNYHYYLPYELVGGRLGQDFFAASAQSYLNPVGYLPFYFMVSAGWHSVAASVVLAVAHSTSLALLYLIARKLFAHLPGRDRVIFSALAAALGGATAVWWATVGTSFLDPLLAPLMLGGLLLLLDAGAHPVRRAAAAGALFGIAAALKSSNAVLAVAALPLALALPIPRVRAGLAYAAGGVAAVALLAGPWHAALWREFGNPVFPLLNAWFQSPHALPFNLSGGRFALADLGAAAAFPFRMALLDRALYAETFAPDFRFAALTVAALALAALAAARRSPEPRALAGADWRLLGFFALAAVLWLASSANARYGIVVLLLAGLALARLAERILPQGVARVALAALLAAQLAASIVAAHSRWFLAEPWSRHWLPYAPPERALREPALYLSVEVLPMAVVAPFLHPGAAFVNFRGQHSLPTDSPRLAALLERYRGRVRTLGRGLQPVYGQLRPMELAAYDATLRRIGYRVDAADCFVIEWRRDDQDALARAANHLALRQTAREPLSVTSCALLPAPRDAADAEAERRMSALFVRIEQGCPGLFRGQSAVTEPLGEGWSRLYNGLDARLEALGGRAILNRYRSGSRVDLGALQDWERGAPRPAGCR
jgi:hypothetical protein